MAKATTTQAIANDPLIVLQRNYLETAKAVLLDIAATGASYNRDRLRQWQSLHNQMISANAFPAGRGGIVPVTVNGIWDQLVAKNIASGTGLANQGVTFPNNPADVQSLLAAQQNGFSGAQSVETYFNTQLLAFDSHVASAQEAISTANQPAQQIVDTQGSTVSAAQLGPQMDVFGRNGPNWGLVFFGFSLVAVVGGWYVTRRPG